MLSCWIVVDVDLWLIFMYFRFNFTQKSIKSWTVETIAMAEIDEKTKDEVGRALYYIKYHIILFVIWQGTEEDSVASTSASTSDSSEVNKNISK